MARDTGGEAGEGGDGLKGPRGLFPGGKRSEAMNMDRQPSDLPIRPLLTLVHAMHKGKWGHVLNFSSGRLGSKWQSSIDNTSKQKGQS